MKKKAGIIYFGALISIDGRPQAELNRRIGAARQSFDELSAVWGHAGISKTRKLHLFDTCVLPRLLYGLQTIWLNEAELKHLDAFLFGVCDEFSKSRVLILAG